jgi:GDP-4-dehydro-6-deoxy-D-mannose reductase
MKALITGVNGFVGKYLSKELIENGYEVIGTDLSGDNVQHVDFLDAQAVTRFISDIEPDYVFHLAGQASVGLSWNIPKETFEVNVCGTINLLQAAKECIKQPRLVIIGSSDQYGVVRPENCPIKETLVQNPLSPYAISKSAQEQIASSLAKAYGLEIVTTRSFNHIGPGQRKGFVVADFSSDIVKIESGKMEPVLHVGNLTAKRDFTDVRDIVRAYRLLAEQGTPGEVYNVGSGKAVSISEILSGLLALSKVEIKVMQDPKKMRPLDIPLIVCNFDKLSKDTGWEPSYPIDETLQEIIAYFRNIENN